MPLVSLKLSLHYTAGTNIVMSVRIPELKVFEIPAFFVVYSVPDHLLYTYPFLLYTTFVFCI
jgi:hypothetical protein